VPPFEEVRDKVERKWYVRKARPLAEEEAKRLAEEVKKAGETAAFRDAGARFGKEIVHLDNVARLVTPRDRLTAVVSQQSFQPLQPYQLPEGKVEYPRPDLTEKLLTELKKKGDTVVVSDQPETTYYVAALVRDPSPPSESAFYQVYRNVPGFGGSAERLVDQLRNDDRSREEYRVAFMQELMRRAGLKLNEDEIKSMRRGGRDDES